MLNREPSSQNSSPVRLLTLLACLTLAACQPAVQPATPPASVVTSAALAVTAATTPQPSPTTSIAPAATVTATLTPSYASTQPPAPSATPVEESGAHAAPVYSYRVVNVFPHDPTAFTQGLLYQDGIFYEGTGLRGHSTLRKVDPATGQVLQGIRLPDRYFGEGIAVLDDRLYQLTWQENTGLVYDKDTFELLQIWDYPGEGWGLTTDGQRLIMSDGTHELRFLDPDTLQEVGRAAVFDAAGQPVVRLNELEWVEGEVWAHVWLTDLIARIDPASGGLLGWIDLTGLLSDEDRAEQRVDVLNGIAYDASTGRLFVTGKWWPKLFEIELVPLDEQP